MAQADPHSHPDWPGHEPERPRASWRLDGERWTLTLAGDWREAGLTAPPLPEQAQPAGPLAFDASQLQGWDVALAAQLHALLAELRDDNKTLVASLRQAHNVCDEHGDIATASLIEVWVDETERRCWFLFEASRQGDSSGH